MIAILKFLHLLGLMLGATASLGNLYTMLSKGPHDLPTPGQFNQMRKLFRLTALIAIGLLWASGILLMLIGYGLWPGGFAFNAKITLVILLTLIILLFNILAPGWARSGGPPSWAEPMQICAAVIENVRPTLSAVKP